MCTPSLDKACVDRSAPLPLYAQLKEVLREKIEQGEWLPGTRIPSEQELCASLGVSRTVVRQALNEMAYEGLLVREQGRGTFVASQKLDYSLSTSISFSRVMQEKGYRVLTRVLDQRVLPAPVKVARALGVPAESSVVYIRRLRFVDERPVAIHKAYLPADRFAGLLQEDLAHSSLWDAIYRVANATVKYTEDTVQATLLRPDEAELLERQAGSPALLIEGVAFDQLDRAMRYTSAVARGDCFRFVVDHALRRLKFG